MTGAARLLAVVAILGTFALAPPPATLAGSPALQEPPFLAKQVSDGALPPIADRVPSAPRVVDFAAQGRSTGKYGGDLRILMGSAKDIRMMVVYGYARLVGYDESLELVPDLLERIEVEGDRVFTLHLRPGHRWSDGHPFTAEDFRYFWEDVANDPDLSPVGPPKTMLVDGEPPVFEVLDETTVRFSWSNPNPFFLPALAGARPLFIYRPAHYLKHFHAKYADTAKLQNMVEEMGTRNWAGLHHRMDRQYRVENTQLPTLQPWMNTTKSPAERYVFVRNPYYHRIDSEGRQLPYIDRVLVNIASSSLIPAKTGAGEADLQARYLRFDNYTFLKAGEQHNDYTVRLWRSVSGSKLALFPNLNVSDPVWRTLVRDVRFRRALSLGIDRHEINQVVFFGIVTEGNNTLRKESPLYRREYQTAWTEYDIERANALLDEIGLTERTSGGIRLLPGGRPLEIIVETAGESTEETDVLELIRATWLKLGIRLFVKSSQREVFRNRIFAGETVMSVWSGIDNGIATADMSPEEFVPTHQDQLQWSQWGQYFLTSGQAGGAPDMPEAKRLMELYHAWRKSGEKAERERIWHEILSIHAEQIFTIGTVAGVPQPLVVSNRLHNVPEDGMYNWDPGAYFGIYMMDGFYFAGKQEAAGGD